MRECAGFYLTILVLVAIAAVATSAASTAIRPAGWPFADAEAVAGGVACARPLRVADTKVPAASSAASLGALEDALSSQTDSVKRLMAQAPIKKMGLVYIAVDSAAEPASS